MDIFIKICFSAVIVCVALLLVVFIFALAAEGTKETPHGIVKWVYERIMQLCVIFGGTACLFLILSLLGLIWT